MAGEVTEADRQRAKAAPLCWAVQTAYLAAYHTLKEGGEIGDVELTQRPAALDDPARLPTPIPTVKDDAHERSYAEAVEDEQIDQMLGALPEALQEQAWGDFIDHLIEVAGYATTFTTSLLMDLMPSLMSGSPPDIPSWAPTYIQSMRSLPQIEAEIAANQRSRTIIIGDPFFSPHHAEALRNIDTNLTALNAQRAYVMGHNPNEPWAPPQPPSYEAPAPAPAPVPAPTPAATKDTERGSAGAAEARATDRADRMRDKADSGPKDTGGGDKGGGDKGGGDKGGGDKGGGDKGGGDKGGGDKGGGDKGGGDKNKGEGPKIIKG